ncbi:MAG TPA: hypothetical protein VHP33_06320 [Polyangiaceae bacterium]|nr:hypothetical protein [Polyangiaceae bacterium]
MRHSRLVALVVAVASFSVVGAASAQTPTPARHEPSNHAYTYEFIDDDLLGDTLSSPPPILKGGWRNRRITLIRPRASFVAEMLTSVETM